VSELAGNSLKDGERIRPPIRATFFARWRVRVGYLLAIVVILLAHPTPQSIGIGGLVGLIGLWIRALAAGHLHKQEMLTVSGPYAHTRNPLYFGSAILTLGAAVAMNSWIAAFLLCGYFALFYSVVMRKEEGELRFHHGAAFDSYAKAVPLFFPRLTAAKLGQGAAGAFSFAQYQKNREFRAAIGFLLLLLLLVLDWRFVEGRFHIFH
jgi:protein-S-isoprenylcysteine O-methyltransferase Ste14